MLQRMYVSEQEQAKRKAESKVEGLRITYIAWGVAFKLAFAFVVVFSIAGLIALAFTSGD